MASQKRNLMDTLEALDALLKDARPRVDEYPMTIDTLDVLLKSLRRLNETQGCIPDKVQKEAINALAWLSETSLTPLQTALCFRLTQSLFDTNLLSEGSSERLREIRGAFEVKLNAS